MGEPATETTLCGELNLKGAGDPSGRSKTGMIQDNHLSNSLTWRRNIPLPS